MCTMTEHCISCSNTRNGFVTSLKYKREAFILCTTSYASCVRVSVNGRQPLQLILRVLKLQLLVHLSFPDRRSFIFSSNLSPQMKSIEEN